MNSQRRELLKAVGSAALSRVVWGANDRTAVAFIGTGVMGRENLGAAIAQGAQAVAVCDVYQPNLERAEAVARKAGQQPRAVRDFREILADRSVDAVCISTPDHWHPYMAVEACKAGKDVYVEKPVCLGVNEGRIMIEAARKHGRIVQAGTWQRSGAHFQKACEIVRNGGIGKVAFCRTWIYANMPRTGIGHPPDSAPTPGLDWDLWLGPAPERTFNPNRFGVHAAAYSTFRFFWDYGGGYLTDSGVHMIDIMQMALGDTMPKAVTGLGGKYWIQDSTEAPDTMQVSLEYDGCLGSWEHRANNTEATRSRLMGLSFHGTLGTLYVDRTLFRITPEDRSGIEPLEMKRVADPHPLHWANFLDCVRTRKRPNSDIETCVRSSLACVLGNASYRSKLRLDWDGANQRVSQDAARPFLERDYRAPWKLSA
ncbi:MAG: Gfo/Idh/MocA family oxidoreductase [Candidatus Solibacter usitatus]|nr:Gfo/Idh/MocA family oxidoreductase [Candidatus Solibacter usitatus]